MNSLNLPPHLKELLVRVVTLLRRKIDVPQDEIEKLVEEIDEGEYENLFYAKINEH